MCSTCQSIHLLDKSRKHNIGKKKETSKKSRKQERQASKREKNNPKQCMQSSTLTCSQCCFSKKKKVHELDINSVRSEENDNIERMSPKSDKTTVFQYQNIQLLISTLLILFFVLYFMLFIFFEIMTNKI